METDAFPVLLHPAEDIAPREDLVVFPLPRRQLPNPPSVKRPSRRARTYPVGRPSSVLKTSSTTRTSTTRRVRQLSSICTRAQSQRRHSAREDRRDPLGGPT